MKLIWGGGGEIGTPSWGVNDTFPYEGASLSYVVAVLNLFWRERAAFQRSAFGRSTAGNDVVATIFIILFFFLFVKLQS